MKIKLFLLSIISCMSILGFTSANYTFNANTNDNALYSPNRITLTESFDFYNNVLNYNCENTACQIIITDENYNQMCDINYNSSDGIFTEGSVDNCNFSAGNYDVFGTMEDQIFSSITFGVNNEGGAEGGNNGNIIAGGVSTFSGTIGRLGEIAGEFIPYMIYIFIGYLGIVLIYNAVKYILLYLQYKSEDTFGARKKYGRYEELREEGGIRVQTPKEREREELAGNEQDEYENLYKQFQDEVINRHYETQEEKLKARIEWKKNHPGSENF